MSNETNYNDPLVNPASAADSVTLAEGNVVSDFDFYPPDFELTQIERQQPQPDPDLITRSQAHTGTTGAKRDAASKNASAHRPLAGRSLHR